MAQFHQFFELGWGHEGLNYGVVKMGKAVQTSCSTVPKHALTKLFFCSLGEPLDYEKDKVKLTYELGEPELEKDLCAAVLNDVELPQPTWSFYRFCVTNTPDKALCWVQHQDGNFKFNRERAENLMKLRFPEVTGLQSTWHIPETKALKKAMFQREQVKSPITSNSDELVLDVRKLLETSQNASKNS